MIDKEFSMDKFRPVFKTGFWPEFYKIGFIFLVALMIGISVGNYYAYIAMDNRLQDVATYKAIRIDGKEYDLKERP
jgi:hypothetical protein